MKDLKQDIRIFQDAKDNKTTIVIWNMSAKTKQKLAELLLGDVQAIETVAGVKNTSPDFGDDVPETANMQDITAILQGKTPAGQIEYLQECYKRERNKTYLQQIRDIAINVAASEDDQAIRAVLYALKDMSAHVLNNLADQMGAKIEASDPAREQKIATTLANASHDTLVTALKAIVKA